MDNYWDSRPTHVRAAASRRGRVAHNSTPVTVGAVTYPSQVAAMKALHIGYKTLARMVAR